MKSFTNNQSKKNYSFIDDLQKNKMFVQKINYHLNIFFEKLNSNDLYFNAIAKEIHQQSFIILLREFLSLHYQNEDFIINSGKIVLRLSQILIKDNTYDQDFTLTINLFLEKMYINNYTHIDNYINAFRIIIDKLIESKDNTNNNHSLITNQLLFLINLLSYSLPMEKIEVLQCPILELIIEIITIKISSQEIQIKLLERIIPILSNSSSPKVIILCLKIIHNLLTYEECRIFFLKMNPVTLIMIIMSKYPYDSQLSFESCNILLMVIEKKDIHLLFSILQENSNQIYSQENNLNCNGLSEVRQLLQSNNETNRKIHRQNIIRLLILLSKETQFFKLLQEIKSIDVFISILKSDLELLDINNKNNNLEANNSLINTNILPVLPLIISLLKISMSNNSYPNYSLSTIKDIINCLIKTLPIVISNENTVKDIIIYLLFLIERKVFKSEENELLSEEFESILKMLLEKYYMKPWFYDFMTNIPMQSTNYNILIKREMSINKKSKIETENVSLNGDIHQLYKTFESYHLIQSVQKRTEFNSLIHRISIILYLAKNSSNNVSREIYNDSSIQILSRYCNKMIAKLNDTNSIFNDSITKDYLITLIFACIENMCFNDSLMEYKISLLLSLIEKMTGFNEYFIICFVRLVKIQIEDDYIFNQKIFLNDSLIKMIFNYIQQFTKNKGKVNTSDDNKAFYYDLFALISNLFMILNAIISISCDKEDMKLSLFLQKDGILNIIDLCLNEKYNQDKDIISNVLKVMQNISSEKHFKESVIVFQNISLLEKLFFNYTSITYQGQNNALMNEDIYYELMFYLKKILKGCDLSICTKMCNVIMYITKELNIILTLTKVDIANKGLQIMIEILSVISMNSDNIGFLIHNQFSSAIHSILLKLKNHDKSEYYEITFGTIITLVNSMIKSKEHAKEIYDHMKWNECLIIIKDIITLHFYEIIDLVKVLGYCISVVLFEKEYKITKKIYTTSYFQGLINKIDNKNNNDGSSCVIMSGQLIMAREMITKCILLLDNSNTNIIQQYTSKENERMYQDLSSTLKTTHKRVAVRYKKNDNPQIGHNTGEDSIDNCIEKKMSNNFMNDTSNNITTKAKYDMIYIKITNCIDMITEKTKPNQSLKDESKELSKLLSLVYLFIGNEDNIPMIYDSDIIVSLLPILNNNSITEETKDKYLSFIQGIISKDKYHYKLLENAKMCNYFLKEMSYVTETFKDNIGLSFGIKKVQTIVSIILILSKEKSFLINNSKFISEQKLIVDIKTINIDVEIICSLMGILYNILLNNTNNTFTSHPKALQELLLFLWTSYKSNQIVLSYIFSIIEGAIKNEIFIHHFLDNSDLFLEEIGHLYSSIKSSQSNNNILFNSNFIGQSFTFLNVLVNYDTYADKLINDNFIANLFDIVNKNIFSPKIIEHFLLVLHKILCKKPQMSKGFFRENIDQLCISIIKKYYITCHKHLIKSTIDIIFILMPEKEHFIFFIQSHNMTILLCAFKSNLLTKEEVVYFLKLFNLMTGNILSQHKDHYNKNINERNNTMTIITNDTKPKKEENFSFQYDFALFSEIIYNIIEKYSDIIDVIKMVYELMRKLYDLTDDIGIKVSLVLMLLKAGNGAVQKKQLEYIELTLEILAIITIDDNDVNTDSNNKIIRKESIIENRAILKSCIHIKTKDHIIISNNKESNSCAYLEGCLFVSFINDILKKINFNEHMFQLIFILLKAIIRDPKFKKTSIEREILFSLNHIINNKGCHSDNIMIKISRVLAILCEKLKPTNTISNELILALLGYISNTFKEQAMYAHIFILDQTKTTVAYLKINNNDKENLIALTTLLHQLYQTYIEKNEMKCLSHLLQIISTISLQSEIIQQSFKDNLFTNDLKERINNNYFTDQVIEYKAKGCLLNLNAKSQNAKIDLIMNNKNILKVKDTSINQTAIENSVKIFLMTERNVKLYKIDGTIIKVLIIMDEDLKEITAYTNEKKGIIKHEKMNVAEMDSCVRSASTIAFKNAKGIFVKKPKPSQCFSILGLTVLNKQQKSFNIECGNESECISYVDYISILINNSKAEQSNNHDN